MLITMIPKGRHHFVSFVKATEFKTQRLVAKVANPHIQVIFAGAIF